MSKNFPRLNRAQLDQLEALREHEDETWQDLFQKAFKNTPASSINQDLNEKYGRNLPPAQEIVWVNRLILLDLAEAMAHTCPQAEELLRPKLVEIAESEAKLAQERQKS